MTTRYAVTGSRKNGDPALVDKALDAIIRHPADAVLLHGAAKAPKGQGVSYDMLADAWARARGVPVEPFEADWTKHGPAAGPIRNRRILFIGKPDVLIHFPGGAGTADMVRQAEALRKQRNTYGGAPLVIVGVTG